MAEDAEKPTVAVAVVSWNTRTLLERCLRSLEPEIERGAVEAWVVDNASTDGSAEMVRERFPAVRLVASQENLGFGRAANLVGARTSTPWLAVANGDVALRPGALARLVAVGERFARVGAVAPRLVLPGGEVQHSVFAFPSIGFALAHQAALHRLHPAIGDRLALPGYWDATRAREVPWAIAAFLLIRRRALEQAGGFDERQWMYAEDLDFGWRLRRAGWSTRYEPSAVVDHESAASTRQAFGHELAPVWQRSTYGFMARRLGMPRTWAIAAINLAGSGLRWLLKAPAARRRGGDARARHEALGRWVGVHVRALRRRSTVEGYR